MAALPPFSITIFAYSTSADTTLSSVFMADIINSSSSPNTCMVSNMIRTPPYWTMFFRLLLINASCPSKENILATTAVFSMNVVTNSISLWQPRSAIVCESASDVLRTDIIEIQSVTIASFSEYIAKTVNTVLTPPLLSKSSLFSLTEKAFNRICKTLATCSSLEIFASIIWRRSTSLSPLSPHTSTWPTPKLVITINIWNTEAVRETSSSKRERALNEQSIIPVRTIYGADSASTALYIASTPVLMISGLSSCCLTTETMKSTAPS
mmetsp:Transcript_10262/g.15582  ORF Transcript_10262/g.15582 Transcript_10262/m.15582 type:complete len:267 (+) Transcript_10262:788-1588(+)